MVTALIRHKPTRDTYDRCVFSAYNNGYNTIEYIDIEGSHPDSNSPYFYNLFCNTLKARVKEGFFFFLDDDDYIQLPIDELEPYLDPEKANIVQMWRGDTGPKPFNEHMDRQTIVNGKIGMPCIVLHAKHKEVADFDDSENADFKFIQSCIDKLGANWIKKILVNSPERSYGL